MTSPEDNGTEKKFKYQHRYVCYARAHGREPDEMLAHDREARPDPHLDCDGRGSLPAG